jgi:hypothetical protein
MIHAYHPTTINLHNNNCPHAVTLWKRKVQYDRSIFQTGVVAHAVLEQIGKCPEEDPKEIADEVVKTICSEGRDYDGEPENPAPLKDAIEGAKLALDWHERYPVENGEGITHEHPFAFDQNWKPVDYNSKEARFRTLLDVVEISQEYDEESDGNYTQVVIRDYKTSWVATENELDTFQRRCQAVVCWLLYKPDIIILEIANLRMKKTFKKQINVAFEEDTLKEWLEEINLAIATLDRDLRPNPGPGCTTCFYKMKCKHFDNMYNGDDLVKKYIAAKAVVAQTEKEVKKLLKDKTPIQSGNQIIGYTQKQRKKVTPDTNELLLETWQEQGWNLDELYPQIPLNVTGVEKIAKIIYKNKAERTELTEKLFKVEPYPSFGIHKEKK